VKGKLLDMWIKEKGMLTAGWYVKKYLLKIYELCGLGAWTSLGCFMCIINAFSVVIHKHVGFWFLCSIYIKNVPL